MKYGLARQHGLLWYNVPPDDTPAPTGGGAPSGTKEKDPGQAVRNAVARYGSAEAALAHTLTENYSYRQRHRIDAERIQKLETQVPEGGVVLTKDQATQWAAYQAMGKPEDVEKAIKEGTDAKGEAESLKTANFHREVGEQMGWNPAVLSTLAADKGIHIEMRDAQVDDGKGGKVTKPVPHARPAANKDAALVLLTDYVSNDNTLKLFMPALKAVEGQQSQHAQGGMRHAAQTQSTNGSGATTSAVQRAIQANRTAAEASNAIRPAPAQGGGNQPGN